MAVSTAHPKVASAGARAGSVPVWAAAGTAAALAADVAFDPAHRHIPLCPFHSVTGLWCPLCGGLRCANALARGHIATALHANIVFVGALPLLAWLWIDWVMRARAGKPGRRLGRPAVIAIVVVLALFTVVRNLPPMRMLRP
jgi:hypothetical protein